MKALLQAKLTGETLKPLLKYEIVKVRLNNKLLTLSRDDIIRFMKCPCCQHRKIYDVSSIKTPDVKKLIIEFINDHFVLTKQRQFKRRLFKSMLVKYLHDLNINLTPELYKWTLKYLLSESKSYRKIKIRRI